MQAIVGETWAGKSQSKQSLEPHLGVGWTNHETEGGAPKSARSAPRICTPRTRPERDAKKAKEEVVQNDAESMHECNQHERVLRSEQQ